ncbi:MAG TPA: tetratricopeptide repeat protein, partial [Candidatus Saccharimonadales bacterium]|nr:tetratricopeptide repeat protein [Candidatus Saccharimonadales bacterium]
MPENRLSLCMIVRDEEAHLRECLSAAAEFVDEMIVVDTGSKDRTVEIAREMGARVAHWKWTGDFSAARNTALARATGDWVLQLDADERMDFFQGARLRRCLDEAPPEVPGLCLRIESEARHRHSGVWMAHYYPRVFRRAPGVHYEGALHEQVIGPQGALCALAPRVAVVIRHLGYADVVREPARRTRNLVIVEEEARRRPDEPLVQRNLANALLGGGEYERARELFRGLLTADVPEEMRQQARWNLCICCLETDRFEEARAALGEDDASQCGQLLLAETHRRSGDPERAIQILTTLLEAPPPETRAVMEFRAEPVHVLIQLALCERACGRPARARAHLEEALRHQPNSPDAHLQLAALDETASELESARAHLERVLEVFPQMEEAHLARHRVQLALGRPAEARAALEAGLARLPGHRGMRRLLEAMDEDEAARAAAPERARLSVCMIVRD